MQTKSLLLLALSVPLSFSLAPNQDTYAPLTRRLSINDDCLIHNTLAWSLTCGGFNDAPRDANNEPITDCNACACSNDCGVINCDGARDYDGKLCKDSCKCFPYCGDNDPNCVTGGTKMGTGGPRPTGPNKVKRSVGGEGGFVEVEEGKGSK